MDLFGGDHALDEEGYVIFENVPNWHDIDDCAWADLHWVLADGGASAADKIARQILGIVNALDAVDPATVQRSKPVQKRGEMGKSRAG